MAQRALRCYAIQSRSLVLLNHEHSAVFRVSTEDGAQYKLRLHRVGGAHLTHRTPSQLASELWWLRQLERSLDAPLPAVVPTPKGQEMLQLSEGADERLCILTRWLDGRFLSRSLRPPHLIQVGRLTARLHNRSEQLAVPEWFDRPVVDRADHTVEAWITRVLAEGWSPQAAEIGRGVLRRVRRVQAQLGEGPGAFGLIHADIHQYNYLFHRGRIRLIDFDDFGWGHYWYDPAVTLNVLSGHPRYAELRQALFAGYRELRPLRLEDETLIEVFSALREVQDIALFLEDRDNPARERFLDHVAPGLARLERFLA
jgi:Ser/Thr protein kinase RdoA (MazF antagonist)